MDIITWLIAALVGAGVMYLLDPQQGKQRRQVLREQISKTSEKVREASGPQHQPPSSTEQAKIPPPTEPGQESGKDDSVSTP